MSAPASERQEGVELATQLGPLRLAAPVLTASGTSGHGAELSAYFELASLGAVVVKSLAAFEWQGNPPPRVTGVHAGMLNSVGLHGPGVLSWLENDLPRLAREGATVIVSIWGRTPEEFAEAAEMLNGVDPCVVAVEVNVSCPNLHGGRSAAGWTADAAGTAGSRFVPETSSERWQAAVRAGERVPMFAQSAAATADALAAASACRLPRFAKLSPAVTEITEIAAGALAGGASGLVLTNTMPAMSISLVTRRPALGGGGGGGLSGTALHPIAVRAVWECHDAFPGVPIVGAGGVASGEDAVELLLAGASAVQVGTATFADPRAPARVLAELEAWCAENGVAAAADLVGAAHD